MTNLKASTLRPGLLVSVKTSIRGNVTYSTRDLDPDHIESDGSRQARWETERRIADPQEHEAAIKARSKARTLIGGVCAESAFGLLCPENQADSLDGAVAEARRIAEEFNANARLTRVYVNVIAGRIAPDDVEAVRAINSEVRDLLADMAEGVKNLNVKAIRDAANRARSLGAMLSTDARARVQAAIDAARRAASNIAKSGEQAAIEIDRRALEAITESRTAFLDMDEPSAIAAPPIAGRAIDFTPATPGNPAAVAQPQFELE